MAGSAKHNTLIQLEGFRMQRFLLRASIKTQNRNRQWVLTSLLAPLFLVCSCGDFVLFGDEDSDGNVEAVVVVSNEEPAACNTLECADHHDHGQGGGGGPDPGAGVGGG